jgi:hypothetical protein
MIYLLLIFFLILFIIGFQDLKSRSYYTFFLPLLFVFSYIINNFFFDKPITLIEIVINILYLTLTFTVLQTYHSFKTKKKELVFKRAFAYGDLFFILFVATLFPLSDLIFFLISASTIGILFYFLASSREKSRGIPFAGLMALLLIPIIFYKVTLTI